MVRFHDWGGRWTLRGDAAELVPGTVTKVTSRGGRPKSVHVGAIVKELEFGQRVCEIGEASRFGDGRARR